MLQADGDDDDDDHIVAKKPKPKKETENEKRVRLMDEDQQAKVAFAERLVERDEKKTKASDLDEDSEVRRGALPDLHTGNVSPCPRPPRALACWPVATELRRPPRAIENSTFW